MKLADQLRRAARTIGGKAWGADKKKARIYMPSRKDTTCYFEFPDAVYDDEATDEMGAWLGGAGFIVYINPCGQAPAWYASQREIVMRNNWIAGLALAAITICDDCGLAADIMALEEITGEDLDEASRHMVNGRTEEVRRLLFECATEGSEA